MLDFIMIGFFFLLPVLMSGVANWSSTVVDRGGKDS
jgi:hypothetical protein